MVYDGLLRRKCHNGILNRVIVYLSSSFVNWIHILLFVLTFLICEMQIYFLEPMVADYFKFINKLPHNFGDKNLKSMCQMDSAPLRVAEGACFPLSELPVLAGHLWYYVAWSCTIPLFLLTLSYVIILYKSISMGRFL